MELEAFKKSAYTDRFATENVLTIKAIVIDVNPNNSSVSIGATDLNYFEFCNLVDKLCHLKKRLKKHHHAGYGIIGKKKQLQTQIEQLQKQLKELEDV